MQVEFHIPGAPHGQARPRFSRRGFAYKLNREKIIEGNVDTDLSADFQIQLAGNIALTATNFAL